MLFGAAESARAGFPPFGSDAATLRDAKERMRSELGDAAFRQCATRAVSRGRTRWSASPSMRSIERHSATGEPGGDRRPAAAEETIPVDSSDAICGTCSWIMTIIHEVRRKSIAGQHV